MISPPNDLKTKAELIISRGSYSNNQFYKNHETFLSMVGVYFVFFHVTEEGWVRRGGKGKVGCGEIFLLELFVRISFPFP